MTQATLWDQAPAPAPARSSDPETSHAAVHTINLKARKREVMGAASWLGEKFTASQVWKIIHERGGMQESGAVRSRLNQLAADGLVEKTGGARVGVFDRVEQLWRLTPKGRSWIEGHQ